MNRKRMKVDVFLGNIKLVIKCIYINIFISLLGMSPLMKI